MQATPTSVRLEVGRAGMVYARVLDSNGQVVTGQTYVWATNNGAVVTVAKVLTDGRTDLSRCTLTAGGTPGSTTITVTAGGHTATIPVQVVAVTSRDIPYGAYSMSTAQLGIGYAPDVQITGAVLPFEPNNIISTLTLLRSKGMRTLANLAGGRSSFKNPDGTFSLTKWKQQVQEYVDLGINLQPFIDDGTLQAHYVIDEPGWNGAWGGQVIPPATVVEMSNFSTGLWPTLLTVVRQTADYFIGTPRGTLGAATAQYEGPLYDGSLSAFRAKQIADCATTGLKIFVGLNPPDGGDGSSGVAGTFAPGQRWQQTAAEVLTYGRALATIPGILGFYSWHGSPYFAIPALAAAEAELGRFVQTVASGTGAPQPKLAANPTVAPLNNPVTFDTDGTTDPTGQALTKFIVPGDGTPILGPIAAGEADPSHFYAPGSFTPTLQVIDSDGQFAETSAAVTILPTGSFYMNTAPLSAPAIPQVTLGGSYRSAMSHRVFYLANGEVASHKRPSLSQNNALLLYGIAGVGKVADVTWTGTSVTLTNTRNVAGAIASRWTSACWSRAENEEGWLFFLQDGSNTRLYRRDITQSFDSLLLDLKQRTEFVSAFGTNDRALDHLVQDQQSRVFAAIVVQASNRGVTFGAVTWNRTTGAVRTYAPPAGRRVLADGIDLDPSGEHLVVVHDDRTGDVVMRVATGIKLPWATDTALPQQGAVLSQTQCEVDGLGVNVAQLDPTDADHTNVFAFPPRNGTSNFFTRGFASGLSGGDTVYCSGYLGDAQIVATFSVHQGSIYRCSWATELQAHPWRQAPDVVRFGRRQLTRAASLAAMTAATWFFDNTWLYVWTPAGTAPQTSGADRIMAFDWRMGIEEIIGVRINGINEAALLGRLCHTHAHLALAGAGSENVELPRCNSTVDGTRVVFASNFGTPGTTRVMAVLTVPEP